MIFPGKDWPEHLARAWWQKFWGGFILGWVVLILVLALILLTVDFFH